MIKATGQNNVCRILCLDGGGAMGFYTLGVLKEIEALLPKPVHQSFDLIFGTSTGSIIAALLSLGHSVKMIRQAYEQHIPTIMRAKSPQAKSKALHSAGAQVFGNVGFDSVKTYLGIVSVNWRRETPMIFKSSKIQAHGGHATFVPGFGCTVADAVEASCSAYPFFERKVVTTSKGDKVELVDGSYCANNPTLYAIADATGPLGFPPKDCRVLSIGCGQYPLPWIKRICNKLCLGKLARKILDVNISSMDQLRQLQYKDVPLVRISESFSKQDMATDIFEHNLTKLNLLCQQGAESFRSHEDAIIKLFSDKG